MIEIPARVFQWTPAGMMESEAGEYVRKRDAEDMLETVHRRAYEEGYRAGARDEKINRS